MKSIYSIFIYLLLLSSCANIVAPTGGEKDTDSPEMLNKKIVVKEGITNIDFTFNEYIQLNKWEEYFYISPPIEKRIQKKIKGKMLTLTIEDTLAKSTTYNIALSNCIKDNNEGNILDTLNFIFSTSDKIDSLTLSGKLQDAYTLNAVENAWIMLFVNNRVDSIIFKEKPNYIAKTNKNGDFHFPNLNSKNYTIVSLTDFDFIYNEEEKIAFLNTEVNAERDSFISLLSFDPIIVIDSIIMDSTIIEVDSIVTDSLVIMEVQYGNLTIISAENKQCIFQLFQNNKVISEFTFAEQPFLLNDITPGKYQIKYIADSNRDGKWTTGSWEKRTQAEQVINYPSEITIRSNWDLELEWELK
ncbi:MAG: Ig-like domain-containing protein, partial [Cryomorphaceae bacterium]|nr:Ig-like domain-containing protein [Cryomorphaceae bacterium]